jgi:diguanylate cyclase (GGDEF)-like protein
VLAHLPWLVAPLLATTAWVWASSQADAWARRAFRAFAVGGLLGLAVQLVLIYQAVELLMASTALRLLSVLPYLAIALGAILVLQPRRDAGTLTRLTADASLLLLVALAVALRLGVEPLLSLGGDTPPQLLLALTQTAAIIPVVFVALIVLQRTPLLSPWGVTLLLLATLTFAVADLLALTHLHPGMPATRMPRDALALAGWVLFSGSGFLARSFPATAPAMLARRRVPETLRKLVVPGAALFLAAAVVDLALGPEPRLETVGAVALLAVLLAARSARAFNLADRDADRLRQIAYTRTLVDVTHALAGTTDLDRTLRIISESARDVFGTSGAGIELIVDDGGSLETRSAVGLPDGVVGMRFPVEGSFTGWVVRHNEPRATADPSRDPYIQPQSLSFLGRWPVAAAPIQFHGETLGALFACIRNEPFGAEELELMGAMAEQAAIAIQQARLFEQVTHLSITDPLTGLMNRRQLERDLAREFAAAQRGRPLAVVMLDLNRFKRYNDAHGHLAGDEALRAMGLALAEETRAMNTAARYGGDEFVVLLSGCDMAGARLFLERLRRRFAVAIERLGHGPLTFVAGVAAFEPGTEDPEELLRLADADLYRRKPTHAAS